MNNFEFKKAEKTQSRARVAIDGPSGSGKTYTSLILARELVKKEDSRIAFIDTESGSASLYSDEFDFDVLIMQPPFNPGTYSKAIKAAEQAGYRVIVVDSLSHAWEGAGGALEMVDKASTRIRGNSWAAWRDVTPEHRNMVDAILQSPAHVIATMRSKMDYVQEKDDRGKTIIRKVGMAPIQRQGMEYEFTLMADMDTEHHIVISKSRCKFMADKVAVKPGGDFWNEFIDWLYGGAPIENTPQPTNGKKSVNKSEPEQQQQPGINKNGARPYPPEKVKSKIEAGAKAKANQKANPQQANLMVGMLEACFAGKDADMKRHIVSKYLTGFTSTKAKDNKPGMTDNYKLALLDWLNPEKDSGNAYTPDPMAQKEANLIYQEACVENGQRTLI